MADETLWAACKECGDLFYWHAKITHRRFFCADKCAQKSYKRTKLIRDKNVIYITPRQASCAWCGTMFITYCSHQRYCGNKCYQHRKNKKHRSDPEYRKKESEAAKRRNKLYRQLNPELYLARKRASNQRCRDRTANTKDAINTLNAIAMIGNRKSRRKNNQESLTASMLQAVSKLSQVMQEASQL